MANTRKAAARIARAQAPCKETRTPRLAVVNRLIEALRLDANNPRHHDRRQLRQIAESIKTFGFNVPVLVDGENNVIAGHGRVLASRELGLNEVPTIRLHHLSAAQARAFMIADNRLAENSVWDERLLAEQLRALSVLDLDFDLEATGFALSEIELRIEGEAPILLRDPSADARGAKAEAEAGEEKSQLAACRPLAPSPRLRGRSRFGAAKARPSLRKRGEGVAERRASSAERDAELARREMQLAERERKLAEREEQLAAWEADLKEREARLQLKERP